jgi:hypothetical protein
MIGTLDGGAYSVRLDVAFFAMAGALAVAIFA